MVGTVITDRFQMNYCSFGTGERAFVVIPGVSMKPVTPGEEALSQAFEIFKKDYTVYIFDRIHTMPAGYSVRDMADDTAAAMEALGISDADIFGASQGGMIAQCLGIDHPEKVHTLYLCSTISRQNPNCSAIFDAWISLANGEDGKALNHHINTHVYSPAFYESYAQIFAAMEEDWTKAEMERFAILAAACREFDIYEELPKLCCPVFVAGSMEDRVAGKEGSLEIAEKLGCPIYMYEGYGHAVYDEAADYRPRMLEAFRSVR